MWIVFAGLALVLLIVCIIPPASSPSYANCAGPTNDDLPRQPKMRILLGSVISELKSCYYCPLIRCYAEKPEWYHDDSGVKRIDALIRVPELEQHRAKNLCSELVQIEWLDGEREFWECHQAAGFTSDVYTISHGR